MDDFEYSVHISERDWDCFFQECEECDLLPPVLAGLDDSGMSDIDDLNCHLSHRTSRQGREAAAHPDRDLIDEPLDCEGSPVEMYLDRYGLCSPDYVLSGSEDDFHIESVNRFFEQLRSVTTAEQSAENHHTEKGNVTRLQENLCSNGKDDDDYPSLSHIQNGPHRMKTDQGAFGSNDVKPKSKKDPRHLLECTGIQSMAATDWYTRSKELTITEEEQPLYPLNRREYDRQDPSYNNFAMEIKVQPVQMGSSDTAVPLNSDLATCRNGIEGLRGDDVYGQPVFRRNPEQREPLPGQTLSPSSAMRRKKRRRKRLSIEPVDAGHTYEGQLQGNHSESDEDRQARRAEIDREAHLSGDFGTVKMADKSNDPKTLSLRSVIDSFSDRLPGQANARTWKGSIPVSRELSVAGNQADSVGLPKAPLVACHSQTSKKMELRHQCTDVPDGRCYEKPLSPVQLVVENGCKSAETPLSANVNKQIKIPTLPLMNSGSIGDERQGVKVSGNLQRIITSALDAQKPDQVPVSPTPVDIPGSSTENRLKIVHSPLEAQSQTDLSLSLNGVTETKRCSYSSVSLTHINSSALDSGKTLPQNYSAIIANSQNGVGLKLAYKMDDFKNLLDSFPDLSSERTEKLKNQQGPTSDKRDSFDASKLSTDGTAASDGYNIKNANTLKCVEPEKIPCKPTNKDSPARSDTVSPVMPLDVRVVQAETSLLDNNNKPCAPPAHFSGPATAECPAAWGKATSDKQMQMKKRGAEKPDQRPDKTQSKQIITYPAETDPKDPTYQNNSLTKDTSPEEQGMHQIYSNKQSERSSQLMIKTDSNDNKSLCELSKVSGAERNVLLNSSTDAVSNTDSDAHKEMMIVTKECNETGNNEIQKYPANSNAVVKDPCKAVSLKFTPDSKASRPNADEDPNSGHPLLPEEASEADVSEKKDCQTISNNSSPVFAMSSFWNEMEKLTINDILRLRLVSQAQHSSILEDGSFADTSHARDSGYFTHVDDSRPDRSSGDVSTMSDFDEEPLSSPLQEVPKEGTGGDEALVNPSDVLWVGDPDPDASTEADDVVVISTETAIPQSRFTEQQYFRKMYKNISVQNLRALENQPLRQILRNASVQSLRSLDDEEAQDPFYHINTSAQFSDDESVVDGHSFSLSEMIEYLFCDDDAKSVVSETENFISSHIDGTSVPENYDHFFSEFEAANLFFPECERSSDSDTTEMMPIFSHSHTANRTLQFPELYDHFFPDSPTQSDEDEEREHSPPIRVVSRYDRQGANLLNSIKTASDSKNTVFWTSPLSLRKVRRTSLAIPSYQANSWSLAFDDNTTKKTGIRTIQPINVMGYEDQGSFPDPLLCDLESRIFRKLAEQKMRCPELQTAVVDPRIDAPLVPLRQADMCLVCIAFASWVLKSASPQGADTWKAVLLANISALSAIRYLRRYVRDEAAGTKPLRQIQS